jgi:NAD dependent epimerase/dehydratase
MDPNHSVVRWDRRKVLVTGAGGFIGSHLVETLVRRGGDVRAFVRYNSRNDFGLLEASPPEILAEVDVFVGDLTNPEAAQGAAAGCDIVLHLGALIPIPYSYRHPREFVAANVEGTLNILEACRRAGVSRLVQTSTSEVYGTAQAVSIAEAHPLHPQSPYAASKVASDQLALSYHRSFDVSVVVARPFNTYGPRQSARAIIPTIVTQALTSEEIELGSVSTTRDFLFVDDTVEGFLACAAREGIEGETFNFGTGTEVSIGELVSRIAAQLGRELRVVQSSERLRPPASEVERLVADAKKARAELGWAPRVDLDEGLRRTIEWVSASLADYKPTIYNV